MNEIFEDIVWIFEEFINKSEEFIKEVQND